MGCFHDAVRRMDSGGDCWPNRRWYEPKNAEFCSRGVAQPVQRRCAPGKRPRATLTPSLALKDGQPFLSFAVQGGDIQDQVQLQFFLAMVEFGMNVQEAAEAGHVWSYQMRNSFADHRAQPGRLLLRDDTPGWTRTELKRMGYDLEFLDRTSGPINAIEFDWAQGTFRGASSDFGEDYGIAW